jgi:hypothetical protein
MPKANINAYMRSMGKRVFSATVDENELIKVMPEKDVYKNGENVHEIDLNQYLNISKYLNKRETNYSRLIDSMKMNLDEMLELSAILDILIRGEGIITIHSTKVQKYLQIVLKSNKGVMTKSLAQKIQQDLAVKIVMRNRETTDRTEAKRLYNEFMNDEKS